MNKFEEVFSGVDIDKLIMYEIYINFSTHNFDELKFVYDKAVEYHKTILSIRHCVKKAINDKKVDDFVRELIKSL